MKRSTDERTKSFLWNRWRWSIDTRDAGSRFGWVDVVTQFCSKVAKYSDKIIFISKIQTASTYCNYILVNILSVMFWELFKTWNALMICFCLLPFATSHYSCCSERFRTCSYGAISQSVFLMIFFSCRVMCCFFFGVCGPAAKTCAVVYLWD